MPPGFSEHDVATTMDSLLTFYNAIKMHHRNKRNCNWNGRKQINKIMPQVIRAIYFPRLCFQLQAFFPVDLQFITSCSFPFVTQTPDILHKTQIFFQLTMSPEAKFLFWPKAITFDVQGDVKTWFVSFVELGDSGATGQLTFYQDGKRRNFVVDILALTKNVLLKVRVHF